MWYFKAPTIVYGDDALCHLETLQGEQALIVTDANMVRLGVVERVAAPLVEAGMEVAVFDAVEPDPSLETVAAATEQARALQADWIIGLGGGSAMDTAKLVRVLAERPDLTAIDVNPIEPMGLTGRVKLLTIPTTSGTGAEVGWCSVITDRAENRKLVLGSRDAFPELAVIDPALAAGMPAWLTADTGMDALVHAVEIYTGLWHNDFVDGPALQAIRLVFEYLPRALADGTDMDARERMHNAATLAGFGLGNANAGLAHALAHALGGVFHPPHGRTTSLFLPYTMQFIAPHAPDRYADIARWLDLPGATPQARASALINAVRRLQAEIGHPSSLRELGIPEAEFFAHLDHLVDAAEADATMINAPRIPSTGETRRLFEYAYHGQAVDF
jgi:acetaldehyde dehydrogenase/alcohol dehydrogenase